MRNYILLFISIILFWPISYSNKSNEIVNQENNQKIKEIQDKITQTNSLITASNSEKNKIIQNAALLESQIQYRTELVSLIEKEKNNLGNTLDSLSKANEMSLLQYKSYKETYFSLMRLKWIQKKSYNPLLHLLQSNDLDAKVRKWYWMGQVEEKTKETYLQMNTILDNYFSKEKEINDKIKEKSNLLELQQKEVTAIENDKKAKTNLIKEIDVKQKNLSLELERYKIEKQKLTTLISSLIVEDKGQKNSAESSKVESSTENWRFPLHRGVIVSRFGITAESSTLRTKNDGIDIRSEDPFVSAAVNAQVVQIKKLPNDLFMVLMRNENYYTVYSNLMSVLVKQDEWVEQGIKIGKCSGSDNAFTLHFEVWKGKTPINPKVFFK